MVPHWHLSTNINNFYMVIVRKMWADVRKGTLKIVKALESKSIFKSWGQGSF